MKNKASIQTDFVINITTNFQRHLPDDFQAHDSTEIVCYWDFLEIPSISTQNPSEIYKNLFALTNEEFIPNVQEYYCHLSGEACKKILEHLDLFISGIDFKHLPSGFFLTRHPNHPKHQILQYSVYLAEKKPQKSPLAITLSEKTPITELRPHSFQGQQARWFEYLRSKMNGFCSEEELKKAFIFFSNKIQEFGLEFFETDFRDYPQHPFNPIVILGRWYTILTQEHLKPIDLQEQFLALPKLDLTRGYSPLRAITDYAQSPTPCCFILPEMFHGSYAAIQNYRKNNFWIYLAFQTKKNSIHFYRQCLAEILPSLFTDFTQNTLKEMLINSTTRTSHLANTLEDENLELKYWQDFCSFVKKFSVPLVGSTLELREQLVLEFACMNPQPNIHFFNSIIKHISQQTGNTFQLLRNGKQLLQLSEKLNECLKQFQNDFYRGARFYFVNDQWLSLDIKQYTELQYQVFLNPNFYLISGHLSTFNIQKIEDLECINDSMESMSFTNLKRCLEFFDDAVNQLNLEDLKNILKGTSQLVAYSSQLTLLQYVKTNFSAYFAQGYFETKEQELRDLMQGLLSSEISSLDFNEPQKSHVIALCSELRQRDPSFNSEAFKSFKNNLLHLQQKLNASEFNFLLTKLLSYRQQLCSASQLQEFLMRLCRTADIQDFKQIYFCNLLEKCPDDSIIPKAIKYMDLREIREQKRTLDQFVVDNFVAGVVLNSCNPNIDELIENALVNIETTLQSYPHLQEYLLAAFAHIPEKQTDKYVQNLKYVIKSLEKILAFFPINRENMLEVYKLFAHFHQTPMLIVELVSRLEPLTADNKIFLIKLINHFMSNGQKSDDLIELIRKLSEENINALKAVLSHPPYPNIQTIHQWLQEGDIQEKYEVFSLLPFGTRQLKYAFDLETFQKQKELFIGVDSELFSESMADSLDNHLKLYRNATISELRNSFLALKIKAELSVEEKLQVLCICIEMLARTTWQWDKEEKISQECNTTQVMALYAMLLNPQNKLISEIGTGEGKSRIKMILAACQIAQGKTVDFMTSDMQLAERDFLNYQAFFSALDIQTSLISLHTPQELYQRQGVNFSDNSQLLLLRNRSDILGNPHAYLDETPERRCLLIDEVDKFMHDKAGDSYNYACTSKKLKSFVWIYPHLVNFVKVHLSDFKAEDLIDAFIEYVENHEIDDTRLGFLANLKETKVQQITTWLNSAHTALHLECDRDYKISSAQEHQLKLICDADGFKRYTREIIVTDTGRPVKDASFALGVHQCLCVIENQKIRPDAEDFVILPENETQRSSFPVSFMAQYQDGKIFGASGTTRYEGRIDNPVINYEDYSYMLVPRHQPVIREDKSIWLAKDKTQQFDFLKRSLREKLTENPARPILLICENDEQSLEVFKKLNKDEHLNQLMEACTRIEALSEKETELEAIQNAGKPGAVTISTVGMFGRGVDIHADNLFVSALYVPSIEDEKQIKGRTGRAGKPGEYRMIPHLEALPFPIKTHYNIEHDIQSMQKKMALQAIQREELAKLYAHFLESITQDFLKESHQITLENPEQSLNFLQRWQDFLNDMQKDWDIERQNLMEILKTNKLEDLKAPFSKFTERWQKNTPFKSRAFDGTQFDKVYQGLQAQHQFFKPGPKVTKRQAQYDISDDGQARIYTTLFAREIATLKGERRWFADFHAWREGRGDLFPDLMATLRGERLLFANLWATIARLLEIITDWIKSWNKEDTITSEGSASKIFKEA